MTNLRFGIPDIELSCDSGTKVNPASFAGHELIVLFCPTDAAEAGQEIAAYRKHCADFVARDAWLLTFADQCGDVAVEGADRVMTVPDPDWHAWVAFRNLTPHPEEYARADGATFLFGRGGDLRGYWRGSGHAHDVLAELQSPSAEYLRQTAS